MISHNNQDPEAIAISALAFLASDPERLGRFLALTGLGPAEIRAAAQSPGFLAGVLDHLMEDESLLLTFTAHDGLPPDAVVRARQAMGAR